MTETQLLELSALTELSRELTAIDCIRIRNAIGLPEGLSEEAKEGFLFLIAFKQWRGHRPHRFYTILRDIHSRANNNSLQNTLAVRHLS